MVRAAAFTCRHRLLCADYKWVSRILRLILVLLAWVYMTNSLIGLANTPKLVVTQQNAVAAKAESADLASAIGSLRDPTRPPAEAGVAARSTISSSRPTGTSGGLLSTIIFSPQRRLAIIDDHIVRVGDKVGSIEVLSIDADSVKVRDRNRKGKEFTLTVHEQLQIKTPVDEAY